jgi:hypothetical protein
MSRAAVILVTKGDLVGLISVAHLQAVPLDRRHLDRSAKKGLAFGKPTDLVGWDASDPDYLATCVWILAEAQNLVVSTAEPDPRSMG